MEKKGETNHKPASVKNESLAIKPKWQHILLIVLLTAMVYSNTLNNEFVSDDKHFIVNNMSIRNFSNIPKYFTSKDMYSSEGDFLIYRPIATMSFAIDYFVWKLNPLGYHITNIVFHILSAISVYLVLCMLFKNNLIALVSSLLFAVHPVQTEAVTFIAGRSNELFMLCFMLSLYFYIKYRDKNRMSLYWMSVSMFIFALLSKEMAITLFVILFLYDIYYKKISMKQIPEALKVYIPYMLIAVLYLVLRISVLGQQGQRGYWNDSFFYTVITMFKVFVKYILVLLLPVNLCIDPQIVALKSFFSLTVLMPGLVLIGFIVLVVYLFRIEKHISFGIAWFLVTILPVSNIIPLEALYAERFMYLPSVGYCIIIGILFSKIRSRRIMIPVLSIMLILYSSLVLKRNHEWRDDFTLWSKTLQVNPNSVKALVTRGNIYFNRGDIDRAIADDSRAIKINPYVPELYCNRGNSFARKGFSYDAITDYDKAIQLNKNYFEAYINRGVVYGRMELYDEAVNDYSTAIGLNPVSARAYFGRGTIYGRKACYSEAISDFTKAIELKPYYIDAYINRGIVFEESALYNEAIDDYSKAIELNPENVKVLRKRALLLMKMGKPGPAKQDEEKAISLQEQ